ncbi:hypothetical protein KDAU_12290 [Dictyobacter aurantiacus]|uniref:Uncharacterized protein n=1 Tax=Dictyobacter aurantiacus TaxID=1936993 RepID=A0A401ZAK4_9CHLR|nr:hypothetical protein KDAU_12290 [Dictyobacter aurantiacus]
MWLPSGNPEQVCRVGGIYTWGKGSLRDKAGASPAPTGRFFSCLWNENGVVWRLQSRGKPGTYGAFLFLFVE